MKHDVDTSSEQFPFRGAQDFLAAKLCDAN